jgi:hypothetical protein
VPTACCFLRCIDKKHQQPLFLLLLLLLLPLQKG